MKFPRRAICLTVVLFLPSAICADTVTLVSSRDTTIYQGAPSNSNGAGQAMFAGNTGQGTSTRGLVGFQIAGNIPAGSTITGVQFSLVLDRAGASEFMPRLIQLRRLLADWGEGATGAGSGVSQSGNGFPTPNNGTTATWTHRFYMTMPWTNAGGDFAATASGSTTVGLAHMAYTWGSSPGMVSDVQSWLDNPSSNFGWLLLGDESTSTTVREFFTREATNSANRPTLVVTFTPPSAPATQLAVTAAASVTAGSPFDVTVTALDNNGNVVAGYTGAVNFTSSDPFPGVLPANYTFTSGDQGTHTFASSVTLFTAGAQTLTAQDTADGTISGSATVAVVAAPANHLLIAASPTAVSGTPFDVVVSALDPYGNVDTNYGGTVTWASSDTDPGVVLPADYTFGASDSGMHAFPAGVTLITVGDQTLAAADTVTSIMGAATITVGSGP
jgi:hypothetical protein